MFFGRVTNLIKIFQLGKFGLLKNTGVTSHFKSFLKSNPALRQSAAFSMRFKNKEIWRSADTGSRKVMRTAKLKEFHSLKSPVRLRKRWKNDNKNFTCENGGVWLTQDLFINLHRYLRVGQTGAKKRMIHGCFIDTS